MKEYKGALVAFLADNLVSHTIGGFKQSMSFAKRFCRSCMATKDESCHYFTAEEFEERTPLRHEAMCNEVTKDASKNKEKSTEYVINERSILNDVMGFSVVGGLCHDIMHDLLEGALPYELKLLLQHTFDAGYISLMQYNDRIKAFDYGYTELIDKPNELPLRCFQENLKLRYSASEMLLLARIIPFILGDKIPTEDMHYNCFLQLLKILQIVMSPYISEEVPSYLRVLIEDHHSIFVTLYPDASFIPKLHYMVHYPKQILEQGPLTRAWTMRYEGKLKHLKGISKSGNFKNITYSLAKKHQKWLSYHLHTGSMFTEEYTRGPIISSSNLSLEDNDIQSLIKQTISDTVNIITYLKWITINGTKFSNQNCFLVTSIQDGKPFISKVHEILSIPINKKEVIYFVMCKCDVIAYDNHFMAYSITITNSTHLVSPLQLPYSSPLHLRKKFFQKEKDDYISPTFFII